VSDWFGGIVGFFARDPSLVLWDIADILLVATVLYYVLLLIRGTRAMQMGIGLTLVFIVYQASKRLGLVTLYAMLDTLLTSIVLIIVVLFQHDIRRALVRFGRRPFFRVQNVQEAAVTEEVVKAATALANKRIGGLIVFERDAALDDFIEPGTKLDAVVSKELLYSIFVPSYENPMHDGAVVIRDGRVQQAGVFLPLTSSDKLDRALGTRHRAAIGITEETDAVVVVVSEERGSVSLCFNGNIVRNLDAAPLATALQGLFHPPKRSSRLSRPEGKAASSVSVTKVSGSGDDEPSGEVTRRRDPN